MSRRRESGSALLEALVGTAIIAMTVATMYRAVIETAARNRMADEKRTALLIAQSELAAVGTLVPLEPGVSAGTQAGMNWRLEIAPLGSSTNVGQLWQIAVSVRKPGGRDLIHIDTVKLAGATS
jgi:hypothetical protein